MKKKKKRENARASREKKRLNKLRQMLEQMKKKAKRKDTSQKSIPFERMYKDGICKTGDKFYTKMVQFWDVNYELLNEQEKMSLLEQYSQFINFFDASISLQLFLFNRQTDPQALMKQVEIEKQEDRHDDIRMEVSEMLKEQIAKGNNGVIKSKYFIFGIKAKNIRAARARFQSIEVDAVKNLAKIGAKSKILNGMERLEVLYEYFHQDTKKPFHFSYREAVESGYSVMDYIAPSAFDFKNPDRVKVGDMHGSIFYVALLSEKLDDEFLKKLLAIDDNVTVSMHLNSMEPAKAVKLVKAYLSDVQKMKVDEQKQAVKKGYDMDIMPADIGAYEKDLLKLIDDLNASNQKVIWTTFMIACYGMDKKKMEHVIQRVTGIVEQANCELRGLKYQQEQALMSTAPIGINQIAVKRNLITSCISALVPFSTQELFMKGQALYYGRNALSGNMILADRKKLRTPNGVILGKPGSGKSFSAKREILSCFLMTKDHIIICDPEGEYYPLVRELDGEVIRLAADSDKFLNPMDIQLSHLEDREALELKSGFIISLCDMIAGKKEMLANDEKGIIDKCVKQIYADYFKNPVPENMPILEDLYDALLEHENPKAKRIADNLYLFVHGSQNYFNHRTNVDSQNRMVCFDIRDLGTQLKELGMLIVQDAVWNRVSRNREKRIATRYYCDEFHLLLREKQTAQYAVEMWKRFRKWGGIPTALTQNVTDFLRSPDIEGILGNSDFVYLLNQSTNDQLILAEKLHLSKEQLKYVTDSEQGSGLIKFDNIVIPFIDKYPTDTRTYAIMTTKPEEAA